MNLAAGARRLRRFNVRRRWSSKRRRGANAALLPRSSERCLRNTFSIIGAMKPFGRTGRTPILPRRVMGRSFFQRLCALVILPLLLLAGGCSTFNRDWKRAAANPVPANDIQGRWDGRWLSEVNGHNGRLRCLVSQSSPGKYEARFHAKYRKILSFGYTVVLNVQRTNDLFTFQGEADLGWLAGGQ